MSQTLQLLPGKYSLYITPPVAGVDFTGVPTPSVSYQWRKNGTAIAGQTNPLLTGVWVEQAGGTVDLVDGDVISIDVILTNPVQVTTKTIAATIDTAQPVPVIDPITIRQLSGGQYQTVTSLANTDIGEQVVVASNVGGAVTITPPTLATYQWRRGFAPIAGATANTYTLQAADADSIIDCVVTATNSGGTASRTASVTVGTLPTSGWTELTPSADSRLIYVATDGDDAAAAAAKGGRGYYLPSDPEIGGDPTNPVGPIAAYQNPIEACKRFRGRNYNGTNLPGGLWGWTSAPFGNDPGYPDWLLFRRGQQFDMQPTTVRNEVITVAPAVLCGTWGGDQFKTDPGKCSGRSITEPGVITAWGPPSDPRPIVNPFGPDSCARDMAYVSIETTQMLSWRSADSLGSNDGQRADNLLLEDIKAPGFGSTNVTEMSNARIRRCVVCDSWDVLGHPQGMYVSTASGNPQTMTIEECVWDRNGYKDDPQQPRSWRGEFVSALTTNVNRDSTSPGVYQYDNQPIELIDIATNTLQIEGTVAPAADEPIADKKGNIKWREVSLVIPSPPVASNPHKLKIEIGRYSLAGQTYGSYLFNVEGVFAITGRKRIRVFNAVTSSWDEFEFKIGIDEQPLRSYRDRNLYLARYDAMAVRGNIISRDGGGYSLQMREGGIVERNLFIWNEAALASTHPESDPARHQGSLVADNVVLHDDCFLPPGGWGGGLLAGGASDDTTVLDGNIVAHFHRDENSQESLGVTGKQYAKASQPASKLLRGIIKDNAVFRQFGGPGIMVMDNVHTNGTISATVTNNAVSTSGYLSMQGNASRLPEFVYSGNRFHSTTPNGAFRWGWYSNNDPVGSWVIAPFVNGTFSQWQAAGFDADATLTSDFEAFKAAVGWTAPERDIVSYMESVDPTYVVNEDVYLDDDSTGAKQDIRRKVWEVMSDPSEAGTRVMTEAQAKLTARRYHAFITFMQRARQNRKGAWDDRWTAEAVNNHIREGFGKPPITGPYDARPIAERILDYTT